MSVLVRGLTFSAKVTVPASNDVLGPLVINAATFSLSPNTTITSIAFPDVTTGYVVKFHDTDAYVKPYASHLFNLRAPQICLLSTTTSPVADLQIVITYSGQQSGVVIV